MNALWFGFIWAALSGSPSGADRVVPPAQTACPAENAQAHRIALALANSPEHAATRASVGMTTTSDVQVLTDADGAACRSMLAFAQQRADAAGGDLTGYLPVFYRVGGYYFAVLSRPESSTPPPPGYVRIRSGFVAVYVFNGNLDAVGVFGI